MKTEVENSVIAEFRKGRAGKERAFATIWICYFAKVCLFTDYFLRDKVVTEGLVNEIFVELWTKHREFDDSKEVNVFLYERALNGSLNLLKERDDLNQHQRHLVYFWTDGKVEKLVEDLMRYVEFTNRFMIARDTFPSCVRVMLSEKEKRRDFRYEKGSLHIGLLQKAGKIAYMLSRIYVRVIFKVWESFSR